MRYRLLLWVIGVLLFIASRMSARVRGQLSRDMDIVFSSADGVARTYQVRNRRVTSRAGVSSDPIITAQFRTGAVGFRIILADDAIGQIVDGLGTGDVVVNGEAAYVLWFYQLVMGLLPWNRSPVDDWPDRYTAAATDLKVSDRITREPVCDELDPDWTAAHQQREKTLLWQVGRGATPWGKAKKHKIVVELDAPQGGEA